MVAYGKQQTNHIRGSNYVARREYSEIGMINVKHTKSIELTRQIQHLNFRENKFEVGKKNQIVNSFHIANS